MLLVAQEYCSAESFKKLIDDLRAKEIRISEDIIDLAKLKELANNYVSMDSKDSFSKTAQIIEGVKGIISGNLKGNPRQAKRFLNTFTTKRKLAELYYGKNELDLTVLAKLLVLQKLNPNLFRELNEWNKRYSTINEEYRQMRDALKDTGKTEDRFTVWKTPTIRKWVESEPIVLENIRLDRYFYLTRESLQKAEIDVSTLSNAAKDVLTRIGTSTPGTVPAVVNDMKELSASDLDDIFKVVLPQITQAKIELYLVAAVFAAFEGYREPIISSLRNYEGNISAASIPQLSSMRKVDHIKLDDLFEVWKVKGTIDDKTIKMVRGEKAKK